MLVSTPFFQELSICILGRCSLQEMANYLIIFPFFGWYKSALYSRNSSLWLLRSRKLTGWLKSSDICEGQRGVWGSSCTEKLRNSAEWFIFDDFSNIVIPNVDICILYNYIRAAYFELNSKAKS